MTRERHFLYLIFDARRPEWRGMAPRPNALMGDIVPFPRPEIPSDKEGISASEEFSAFSLRRRQTEQWRG
jgi:hypothetical protein